MICTDYPAEAYIGTAIPNTYLDEQIFSPISWTSLVLEEWKVAVFRETIYHDLTKSLTKNIYDKFKVIIMIEKKKLNQRVVNIDDLDFSIVSSWPY